MTMKPALIALGAVVLLSRPAGRSASAQVTAKLPPNITPPWSGGIQAINRDNYWNAIACGKQGGQRPLCVFYDAELCPNDDFELSMFTPYKLVAYEVWRAVRARQEPPTPSYSEAQRTRITVKLVPKPAAKNPLTALVLKRGASSLNRPRSRSMQAAAASSTTSRHSPPPRR